MWGRWVVVWKVVVECVGDEMEGGCRVGGWVGDEVEVVGGVGG